ncbi:hypothetical protein [Streptomyces sp. NPDC048603]|uniref:hypothetical protein n=1 Tax=Streptomyces sp. NPDC048603 TaxID=3365577 RepID=UPI00372008F5
MTQRSTPPMWFRLPPGFHDVCLDDCDRLDDIIELLAEDHEAAAARRDLDDLMRLLERLTDQHLIHTSIGLHPEQPTGVAGSVFSLALRPTGQHTPSITVVRALLAMERSPLLRCSEVKLLSLPSTAPCGLVAGTLSLPGVDVPLFQARVALAHAESGQLVVADLTSASVQHSAEYSAILEGIAHTITFINPVPPQSAPVSRIQELT